MDRSKLFLAAFGLYIVYKLLKRIQTRIAHSKFEKAHGCLPPPAIPQSERILGFQLLKESAIAVKNKNSLELGAKRFTENGNTYSNMIAGMEFITTIDPLNLQAVLATSFKDYDLGGRIHAWGPLVGQGIFTSDGEQWSHRRALLRPNFHKQQIANLEMFERHIQHLVSKIPRNGATVDLQKLFFNMTLDSATEFLFGSSVGAQGAGEGSEAERFQTAFDFAQHKLPGRNRLGALNRFIRDKEFNAACKIVKDWADKYVAETLAVREKRLAGEKEEEEIGTRKQYIVLNELANEIKDKTQLRDEMLNVLLAGRDTTAGLLSNAFHAMARHPEVWEKLQEEVSALEGRLPTYEDLKNMKFLKSVMNETLRLFPPVPNNARYASRSTVLPRGGGPDGQSPVHIKAGTIVMYPIYALHRRRDIYGDNADDFVPERWSADAPGGPLRPGWGFIPFNGGPRICVGQQYALTEAGYAIVRLCQMFKGCEYRGEGPWKEGLGLTLCSGEGTKVGLTPA
ncbi:cytochrome P450 [Halenospora varia]|nr:cytochrome P450 [Halenospora varia]